MTCVRQLPADRRARIRRAAALSVVASMGFVASGCATTNTASGTPPGTNGDPLEVVNRDVFAFNQALDRVVIKPAAYAYRAVLPTFVRDRIRAVVDNLHEPLVLLNDVLQGRGKAAAITTKRFVINSTVGVAGMFDRATGYGLPRQSGDFGQTLYVWGIANGPYLMLPIFGPSNLRDAFGLGVDTFTSLSSHIGSHEVRHEVGLSTGAADGIDQRSRHIEDLDAIQESSLDFYAYLRSVSQQNRQTILDQGRGVEADTDLQDPGAMPATPGTSILPTPAANPAPGAGAPSTPTDPGATPADPGASPAGPR